MLNPVYSKWRSPHCHQSFANISRATSDQLQNLPGFGQIKVKNVKNVFDKPFRNNATSSLSLLASQSQPVPGLTTTPASTSYGKRKARTSNTDPSFMRETSPVWDIELDDEPTSPSIPTVNSKDPVVFDIDLDLN